MKQMDKETALQAWKRIRSEIDTENWLFVGTINPEMVDRAIEALEGKDTNIPTKEDVIPVEWIEKKRDGLVSDYKYIIDWLILEWKKEQGEIHNDNQ